MWTTLTLGVRAPTGGRIFFSDGWSCVPFMYIKIESIITTDNNK